VSTPAHAPTIVELRHATRDDGASVADIFLESFTTTLPRIQLAHTDAECREHFSTTVIDDEETWVAVVDGEVVGFVAIGATRIDHLYLRPAWTGRGIGRRLLELAKYRRQHGLDLWTFQVNAGARRFYERNGFVNVEETDGDNEEGEPDVRYAWPGRHH
jgi:GNAT superfamily N-acetyltransferase